MRDHYTLPRLYLDAPLAKGAQIALEKPHAHYLITVLRKGQGDSLRVFNGEGGEWLAVLTQASKSGAQITLAQCLRPPAPCPDIWLCFALVRKERCAVIAEKATELGAAKLVPVITARTQFPKMSLDKLAAQMVEAAEQTERLDVPKLEGAVKLDALLSDWDSARTLIFADEAGDCPPALSALEDIKGPAALLIGPEGGFTDEERAALRAAAFVRPVSLGPRILRAETAALSLLTLWQAAQGDWR